MAIKTFTAGSVLTASDTNTYLANSGLVYVKSYTVGSGVTSVTLTDAFSSTYDNYRVMWTGGVLSALALIQGYMGTAPAANGYYGSKTSTNVSGGFAGNGDNNATLWQFVNAGDATFAQTVFEIYAPFLNKQTYIDSMYQEPNGGSSIFGRYTGFLNNSNSYTSMTIDPQGATTMTGGTITVYGYRKA